MLAVDRIYWTIWQSLYPYLPHLVFPSIFPDFYWSDRTVQWSQRNSEMFGKLENLRSTQKGHNTFIINQWRALIVSPIDLAMERYWHTIPYIRVKPTGPYLLTLLVFSDFPCQEFIMYKNLHYNLILMYGCKLFYGLVLLCSSTVTVYYREYCVTCFGLR